MQSLFTVDVDLLRKLLPVLIPFIILQYGLMIAALVHILRSDTYKVGNRLLWVLTVLLVNIIGPVLYFVIGRGEKRSDDNEPNS